MIKAELLKPLDGDPEGTIREFDKPDYDRLVGYGAVRRVLAPPKAAKQVANKLAPPVANKSAAE
jgi:hypothetical protein